MTLKTKEKGQQGPSHQKKNEKDKTYNIPRRDAKKSKDVDNQERKVEKLERSDTDYIIFLISLRRKVMIDV